MQYGRNGKEGNSEVLDTCFKERDSEAEFQIYIFIVDRSKEHPKLFNKSVRNSVEVIDLVEDNHEDQNTKLQSAFTFEDQEVPWPPYRKGG